MRFGGFNKYRNAVAVVAGREAWYSELAIDTVTSIASNGLAADDTHIYVKTANGHSLQALALDQPGKVGSQAGSLGNSAGRILDWSTALYDTSLLAASDDQGTVTVWRSCSTELTLKAHASACDSIQFHPTVASVLATTSSNRGSKSSEVKLWNVNSSFKAAFWETPVVGIVDSIAVRGDGQLISASTHDGEFLIYDPRHQNALAIAKIPAVYAAGRPTRVIWLGEKPYLMTTGLTKIRERSVSLWDQRNLAKPLASLQLQPSTKPLIPLYDEDTQLAYLVEKGDNSVRWVDADPSSAKPLVELGSTMLQSQISGCALLPKRALRVMSGEISRVHLVVKNIGAGTGSAVVPISHLAPRRSYLDFHCDIYPDTRAPLPAQTFDQWMANEPMRMPKMTLDPAKTADCLASLRRSYGAANQHQSEALSEVIPANPTAPSLQPYVIDAKPSVGPPAPVSVAAPTAAEQAVRPSVPKKQWVPVQHNHARFKYLEGYFYRPSEHFSSIQNVNLRFSQENEPLKVSSKFIAVACEGAGGQIGIIRRDAPGRVSAKLPTIVHGSNVVSIEFDPFDPNIVATAGSDCKLQMWRIPESMMDEDTSFELEEYICVTADRIHQIRFHPWAKGVVAVLVSEANEQAIYVYHGLMLHFIIGKTADGIHSFAWSPDGELIALTTRKSRQLRIYNPRTQDLLSSGPSMDSIRPCRIAWVGNSRICLTGFGSGSQRQIAIYETEYLAKPIIKTTIDVGPGLLVPVVDADCGIIYLDDRGSRLTHAFELVADKLVELPKLESAQPSLGLAMVPKRYANISQCEIGRVYRLSSQTIESVGYRVPRKRPEYFQDDLFPDTWDSERSSVNPVAWVKGTKATPVLIGLCPPGMQPLSQAPPEAIRRSTFAVEAEQPVDNSKDAISAMLSRVEYSDEESGSRATGSNSADDSASDWDD
ncbi:hypothetical protein BX661DRAFT_149589 [Kickxella alabastrina]|uniref:uncharacterized protein n=1 Tax=Kickxella alabastrina TaxID=61397 RepID=UPI002220AA53|nr:uncharacterized protein BX661DRAFT_149589 [Kickxella alabastrina]KAI7834639.1 hypothetical protein BX661DRAFT_149589 [Kickxella alabastrina]